MDDLLAAILSFFFLIGPAMVLGTIIVKKTRTLP